MDKKMDDETYFLLQGLSKTKRVKRNDLILQVKYGKSFGDEGEFYFNPDDFENYGQSKDESIINFYTPPSTQASLWLDWHPGEDRQSIKWSNTEKTYYAKEWFEYLIAKIFVPRGYRIDGILNAEGEDGVQWHIKIENNIVFQEEGLSDEAETPDFNKWVDEYYS